MNDDEGLWWITTGDCDDEFDLENSLEITLSLKATADTLRINVDGVRFNLRFRKKSKLNNWDTQFKTDNQT